MLRTHTCGELRKEHGDQEVSDQESGRGNGTDHR